VLSGATANKSNRRADLMGRAGRRPNWDAVAAVTAVAGLVLAAAVWLVPPLPWGGGTPVDERLELVDVEFGGEATNVLVLEDLPPGREATVSPRPGYVPTGADKAVGSAALVITLRNPTDDTAVLTGVKLVVHEVVAAKPCGRPSGGGVAASVNYDFRFDAAPWSQVNPQNFAVAPRGVDALSITMGPFVDSATIDVWRFSVYGVSTGGNEIHWADGVAANVGPEPVDHRAYIWDLFDPATDSAEAVRSCAAEMAEALGRLLGAAGDGVPFVVQPAVRDLVAEYERSAAP
jgi:hypothetical protein